MSVEAFFRLGGLPYASSSGSEVYCFRLRGCFVIENLTIRVLVDSVALFLRICKMSVVT